MASLLSSLKKRQAEFMSLENTSYLTAKDAMIRPVIISTEDNAEKILRTLAKEKVNACLVVDSSKVFKGEIGDFDMVHLFEQQVKSEPLVKLMNKGYNRDLQYRKAKEIMRKHTRTVTKNTPINKVISLIGKRKTEYLPVVDEQKRVIGVVTPSSLIKLLIDH